jgi:hypothetical protein
MKKKIMIIGMSVLMTMTGLKAQQEILDKNDFRITNFIDLNVSTWTVVDNDSIDLNVSKSNSYSKQEDNKKKRIKENQQVIGGILVSVLFPAVIYFATNIKYKEGNSYNGSGGSSGCGTVQCSENAVSTGQRCKNETTDCSGRCHHHR